MEKPHRGTIYDVYKIPCSGGLGYALGCTFKDHPVFAGQRGHTSYIVKNDGNEVETRNSRYTIEGVIDA